MPHSNDEYPMSRKPLIGVSACTKQIGHHSFHIAGDKYLRAAAIAGVPLVIPALDELIDPATLLESFDGLLFTGSPSNVEPHHYGGPASEPGTHHDPFRDRLTLPLIRAAVDAGIPVFGICRGFQEMNVAFGGSLHQKVHEAGTYQDHRERPDDPLEVQYGLSHALHVQPGGLLERLGLGVELHDVLDDLGGEVGRNENNFKIRRSVFESVEHGKTAEFLDPDIQNYEVWTLIDAGLEAGFPIFVFA